MKKFILHLICALSVLVFSVGCAIDTIDRATVLDENTGLRWTRCSMLSDNTIDMSYDCSGAFTTYTWSAAVFACDNLKLAGRNDWRLPNIRELQSIVTYYLDKTPMINQMFFPRTKESPYWSSTTYNESDVATNVDAGDYAWTIDFLWGNVHLSNKEAWANKAFVRCVTGP